MINRRITGRHYHQYIHPQRDIDAGALEVHGITLEFLAGKPTFEEIATEFAQFVEGAELIIHNAPFDVGFIDAELERLNSDIAPLNELCSVLDTLQMARHKHPGQRNNLTRSASDTRSITPAALCTVHCWMRRFLQRSILR